MIRGLRGHSPCGQGTQTQCCSPSGERISIPEAAAGPWTARCDLQRPYSFRPALSLQQCPAGSEMVSFRRLVDPSGTPLPTSRPYAAAAAALRPLLLTIRFSRPAPLPTDDDLEATVQVLLATFKDGQRSRPLFFSAASLIVPHPVRLQTSAWPPSAEIRLAPSRSSIGEPFAPVPSTARSTSASSTAGYKASWPGSRPARIGSASQFSAFSHPIVRVPHVPAQPPF